MIIDSAFFRKHQLKAILRVTGEDAFSFLQGQFTNELRHPPGSATYGLWLNQKGRVVADSIVLRLAENEFLVLSVSSAASVIQQRLQDYIVADDVGLTDETATVGGLTIGGAGCGETIRAVFGAVPSSGHFIRNGDGVIFNGYRLPAENYEIIGPEKTVADWRERLVARGWAEIGIEAIEWSRISANIPAIPQDLGPTDLPNEGGLEESALSFTKGCYLGQEIMARLKNLGQVRRRLQVVHSSGVPLRSEAPLYQGSLKVGELRSVSGGEQGYVAFAMLSLINLKPEVGLSLAPDGPTDIWIGAHE